MVTPKANTMKLFCYCDCRSSNSSDQVYLVIILFQYILSIPVSLVVCTKLVDTVTGKAAGYCVYSIPLDVMLTCQRDVTMMF